MRGGKGGMVLIAALRAFPSIFHPAARRLLGKTLVLSLLAFGALGAAMWFGLHALRLHFGLGGGGFAEATGTALGVIGLGWLLFRAVSMAIMSLFADDIIIAVERDAYPAAAARARSVGFSRSARLALASLLRAVLLNLLALPLYILLLATGIGTVGLFLLVNAWLLGRDMADMVEPRHPDLPPIGALDRWLMGLVSALLFLAPGVNLLAPIWSAAMAAHRLHGRQKA
jgi:hypothetical protein